MTSMSPQQLLTGIFVWTLRMEFYRCRQFILIELTMAQASMTSLGDSVCARLRL
jgi:hypothetical protein